MENEEMKNKLTDLLKLKNKAMLPSLVLLVFASCVWISTVQAASYDCGKAKTKVEKLICTDPQLSELDVTMDFAWREVLANLPNESKGEQQAWLAERNVCKEDFCIQQSYRNRLEQLDEKIIQDAILYRKKNTEQISYPDAEKLFGIWEAGERYSSSTYGTMIISKQQISWTGHKPNPGCKTQYTINSREADDTFPDQDESFRHIVKSRRFITFKLQLASNSCTDRLAFMQFSFPSDINGYVEYVEYDKTNRPNGPGHFFRVVQKKSSRK
jgi:uncharacterized protein